MGPLLFIPLVALAAVCIIMFAAWVWAVRIHNYSVVDFFWAINFAVVALIIWLLAGGLPERKILVCSIATLWSLRLGLHLGSRILSHLDEEEGRYQQLRKEWNGAKFFIFFQMQALSNVFLAIPFFIIAGNPQAPVSAVEYIGAAIWLIAIAGEGIADWQLRQFKKDPANRGKVCTYGLWNYSRHPNYFFQLMIWIGVLVFALPSPYGWLAVLCPLSIAYLLFKVTGIPMNEEQSLRSKGDAYRRYQQTTSAFVPWFKKS